MISAHSIQFEATGLSDQGQVRKTNEDAIFIDAAGGLFMVADGMGGHRGGGVASRAVVQHLPSLLDRRLRTAHGSAKNALRDSILDLNAAIRTSGQQSSSLRGMGSTLACLLIRGGRATVAHMGDSRVYRWRGGLECLTQDHSVTALLVREGEISARSAAHHPARGQLTRFIGMEQEIYPDVSSIRVRIGDRFMLCTDGLWGVLSDKRIAEYLASDAKLDIQCTNLISAAKEGGSQDNITCVLVSCENGKTWGHAAMRGETG